MESDATFQLSRVQDDDVFPTHFHKESLANLTSKEQMVVVSEHLETLLANIDILFQVLMGSLIILMQAGFGFLEAGSVRAKNTTNILIKNYADLCFGSLSFWLVGFALAFGEGSPVLGFNNWFASGLTFKQYSFLFFQCTFAATCATIVSGAIAERCNFNGYVIFSIIVTGVTYPIAAHWCWGPGGWLAAQGFHDFAGSGVVHLSGGTIALVGAVILGPRIDRFKDKKSTFIAGHSIPHISLGGFILIFGFMAFNAGSNGSISQPGDGEAIGAACLSTLVSCASGGITVLIVWKYHPSGGKWSLSRIINGCLAGMVSVCSGCDEYYPWMAAMIGCVAGIIYVSLSSLMVRLKIDDPLDAVAVHAGSGIWGLVAAPLLTKSGLIYTGSNESLTMLLWNAVGGIVLVLFHAVTSAILFFALHSLHLFRVQPEQELEGLDVIKHDEPAYAFEISAAESMWPGIDELKTLSKKLAMEEKKHPKKIAVAPIFD